MVDWTEQDLEEIKAELKALIRRKASLSTDGQAATEHQIRQLQDHYDWVRRKVIDSGNGDAGGGGAYVQVPVQLGRVR